MTDHEKEIRDSLERGLHIDPYAVRGFLREVDRERGEVAQARKAWLGDDYGHLSLYEALEKLREDLDTARADIRD
jgi:hypothetical protein